MVQQEHQSCLEGPTICHGLQEEPPPASTNPDLPDQFNVFCIRFEAPRGSHPRVKVWGPDMVSPAALKHCSSELAPVFTDIFNQYQYQDHLLE